MSALRQLLGALWAAVWLRGRLLGLKLRRLFVRGPEPGTGPDFHLLGADVLADEAAHEPIELPAELAARLESTRAELLGQVRRGVPAPARPPAARRRVTSIVVVSLLGLGVVGAGASALVTGSTGVPAVDKLLGIYENDLSRPGSPGDAGHDLRPRAGGTSASVYAPLGEGGWRVVNTAYVGREGNICLAVTSAEDSTRAGLGSALCEEPRRLGRRLARNGGLWGVAVDAAVVLSGVVRGDVSTLSGQGPNGPLEVYLGDVWKPDLPGVGPMRPFLAIGSADIGDQTQADGFDRLMDLRAYDLRAHGDDGKRLEMSP